MNDKPKRRWYQFGLMHMLLALTGVCLVPGGIVAYFQNESARQRAAVRDLEEMRGTIRYDETVPPRSDIVRSLLGDDSFSRIIGVSFLPNTIVIYDKSGVGHEEFRTPEELRSLGINIISDDEMKLFQGMRELRFVDVSLNDVSDRGLSHLTGLHKLEWLEINGCNVTDDGLAILSAFPELTRLALGGTRITDAGMIHIARLSKLEQLVLEGTKITDVGLTQLQHLPHLEYLVIEGTNVSQQKADEFDNRPGCMVVR